MNTGAILVLLTSSRATRLPAPTEEAKPPSDWKARQLSAIPDAAPGDGLTEIATAANSLGPPAACGRPPSLLGAGAWAPQSLAIPEEAGKAMEASGLGEEEST